MNNDDNDVCVGEWMEGGWERRWRFVGKSPPEIIK